MTKLVFGCGYLGRRVAHRWLERGEEVAVVTRSSERAAQFRDEGFRSVVADVSEPSSLKSLPRADTVLYAVGYDYRAAKPRNAVVVDGLRNTLNALSPRVDRILFTSSTGVMGNHNGEWVDETASCLPNREAGICGLEAETVLQSHELAGRVVILRLAGLYGPDRLPKLADVRSGRPVAAPDQAWLNLIHVEDAVEVILAAEQSACPPDLFLVSDGNPIRHRHFYREMARQLRVAPPTFTQPEPGSRAAAAAMGNKRVDNRRMLRELKVRLHFPSCREGLAAICSDMRAESA